MFGFRVVSLTFLRLRVYRGFTSCSWKEEPLCWCRRIVFWEEPRKQKHASTSMPSSPVGLGVSGEERGAGGGGGGGCFGCTSPATRKTNTVEAKRLENYVRHTPISPRLLLVSFWVSCQGFESYCPKRT